MTDTTKHIPRSECIQGRCANITTGCWGECSIRAAFPLDNVACGDAVQPRVSEQADIESIASNADAMIILTQSYPREAVVRVVDAHAAKQVAAALAQQAAPFEQEDEQIYPAGYSPSIVDADGLPKAMRTVIETKGSYDSLEALYAFIDTWGEAQRKYAITQQAAPEAPTLDRRFFMDHGVWHDRVTGTHMWTQDQYDEESRGQYVAGVEDQMHGIAQAWALTKCSAPAPSREAAPQAAAGLDERALFEAQLPNGWDTEILVDGEGDDFYADDLTQGAFIGWGMARAALAQQSAERAAAEDAERLDFIESRHLVLDPCESEDGVRCYEVNEILGDKEDDSKRTLGSGKTAREAIDAARAAHPGDAPAGEKGQVK